MNNLTDEQMDKIIKSKFQNDNKISDKANAVFTNFNPKQFNNQFMNDSAKQSEATNNEQSIKHEINNHNNAKNMSNAGKKIVEVNFYQKLNRILSVAAVSLTVVLVGGSVLYFNRGGNNNSNNQTESIVYNQTYLVKNEKLELSNEKVFKYVEDGFVKAYMLGKQDVGINLTSKYWNEFGKEFSTTDCYKVDNITENVSDIFIGEIGGSGLPYVFLLMEDGTIQYVDLHCYTNNEFYFVATKLEGLDDVVGFEQKSRKFSYSNTDYEYVNAIRSDGLKKEIEIGVINDWNDTIVENYDRLNEKYIKTHNGQGIPDDGKGDFEVDGIHYWSADIDNRYVYYMKGQFMGQDLYRVERSTGKETIIATGITGMIRDNQDGRISLHVNDDNYAIYELDNNIIYRHRDNSVISKVTSSNPNLDNLSEFERRVYESGNYYYSKNGHYCIKNPREVNIAYYIQYQTLYRVIIPNNDSVASVATGVVDIVEDNEQNLIVTMQLNGSLFGNYEGNVIFRDETVTDSPVIRHYSYEDLDVLLKEDGSLTALIHTGGLQRLGINRNETGICENVYYNMYGSAHGVENKNTHLYYANAKKGIIAKAGKNGRLCFVYEKADGNVVAIDIKNAIECGSFTGARTSQCYIEGTIENLYVDKFTEDKDNNGNSIPPYETIFILEKTKTGKERRVHMFMPCEDE